MASPPPFVFDFDTLPIPFDLGEVTVTAEPAEIKQFQHGIEDPDARYWTTALRAMALLFDRNFGQLNQLNAGMDARYHGYAEPGSFTSRAVIAEKYERRGKRYVRVDADLRDAGDRLLETVSRLRMVEMAKGIEAWKAPAGQPPPVQAKGPQVGLVEKHVTPERIRAFETAFESATRKNFHLDDSRAREAGLEQTIASGHMLLAYAHHVLREVWGESWIVGGAIQIRFRRPVVGGDRLLVKAFSDTQSPNQVLVEGENQRGELVFAGRAQRQER